MIKSDVVVSDPNRQLKNVRRIMFTPHGIEKLIARSDLNLYIETPQEKERMIEKIES